MHRRDFLRHAAATAALPVLGVAADAGIPATRGIPSTKERLPVVGLGTWLTFDVGREGPARDARGEVLRAFFSAGGRLVDSSPMYGASEEVVGAQLSRVGRPEQLFSATKVWTVGGASGRRQMEKSRTLWGLPRFDLVQVHNMLDWEAHLDTLKAWKAEGRVRHVGITTSHGRRHDLAEEIVRREKLDFLQFTYSLADRQAEARLLPVAAERGVAVIVNRPFDGGALFSHVRGKPLPALASEIGCTTWAGYFLKYIASHPAVTCAIPATTQVAHLRENMAAASGPMPDAAMRRRMAQAFDRL